MSSSWGESGRKARDLPGSGLINLKKQKKDTWEYTNEYGEQWIFEYDPTSGEANLKGSDIDWQSHQVINGKANGLILNEGELKWLKETWEKVTENKSGYIDFRGFG